MLEIGEAAGDTVFVPVQSTNEVVAVDATALPDDPNDVLEILQAEQAPLELWLHFAKCYLRQGMTEQFRDILEDGSSPEIEQYYATSKYERIQILIALADFHLRKANSIKEKSVKQASLKQAQTLLEQAARIDQHEMLPVFFKGQIALAKGDNEEAAKLFEQAATCKDNKHSSIMPMLAKAAILYHRKLYPGALRAYEDCLRTHPHGPAGIRLGLGLCHLNLGNLDRASMAFKRTLHLDPSNVHATLALAVVEMSLGQPSSEKRKQGITHSLGLLSQAYSLDPKNAQVLNYLANHFLMRSDYEKVLTLAKTAFDSTDMNQTRAESCYLMARAYHAQGRYGEAGQLYSTSVSLVSEFGLAHHGLGQLALRSQKPREALAHFQSLMAALPDNLVALKAIGSLNLALGRKDQALQALKSATEREDCDAECWAELGEVLERADPPGALNAYTKALTLNQQNQQQQQQQQQQQVGSGSEIPAALYNNVAVLSLNAGDLKSSEELFDKAMKAAGVVLPAEGEALVLSGKEAATIVFNRAQLFEAQRRHQEAAALYHAVLKEYPDMVECWLRLAQAACTRGDLQQAETFAREALEASPGCVEALAVLAQLDMQRQNWDQARASLTTLNQAATKDKEANAGSSAAEGGGEDPYAQVGLANVCYLRAIDLGRKHLKKENHKDLDTALHLYQRVLQQHPDNIFAANGIASVLAEQGMMEVAREALTTLQEVAATQEDQRLPEVWVNLAHIHLAHQQYTAAITMYHNTLRKFYHNNDAQIWLYMARAYYDWDKLQECKRTLLRALHLNPTDHRLRFNIALAMQEFAFRTLQKQRMAAVKKYSEVVLAVEELRLAHKFFTSLHTLATHHQAAADAKPTQGEPGVHKSSSFPIDAKKAQSHVQFCSQTLEKAQVILDASRREEERAAAMREEQRQRLKAESAMKSAEESRRAAEEEQKRQQAEEQARLNEERLSKLKSQWGSSVGAQDMMMDSEDQQPQEKKKKTKQRLTSLPEGESSSDDEDPLAGVGGDADAEAKAKAALKAAGLGSDSDEDEDQEGGGGKQEEQEEEEEVGGFLSSDEEAMAMQIDDEDDDEDGEEGGGKSRRDKKKKHKKKEKRHKKDKKKDKAKKKKDDSATEDEEEDGEDAGQPAAGGEPARGSRLQRMGKRGGNDDDEAEDKGLAALFDDDDEESDQDFDPIALAAKSGEGRKRGRTVAEDSDVEDEEEKEKEPVAETAEDPDGEKSQRKRQRAVVMDSDDEDEGNDAEELVKAGDADNEDASDEPAASEAVGEETQQESVAFDET